MKRIDEFEVGDKLLSRSEFDVNGPVEEKVVEEVFVRVAPIWNLHVGGNIIRTTAEHPFYVYNKGWVPTAYLQIGDLLSTHDGKCVRVDGVADSGEVTTVYNLRVSDFHTYFVGGEAWAFDIWAHNSHCAEVTQSRNGRQVGGTKTYVSGGYTLKNGQKNTWKLQAYSHTEAKIARDFRNKLKPGDTLTIKGTKPPCDTYAGGCQRIMSELARKTGATVKYKWTDTDGVNRSTTFRPNQNNTVTARTYANGRLTGTEIRQADPLGASFWLRN